MRRYQQKALLLIPLLAHVEKILSVDACGDWITPHARTSETSWKNMGNFDFFTRIVTGNVMVVIYICYSMQIGRRCVTLSNE